jgi:ribonucleoside-diphosphate reductase alpha chain
MGQYNLPEVNTDLVKAIKHVNGLYSTELMDEIARVGSIQKLENIPKKIREIFVTAMDIAPVTHVKMLASFQKYTDNAVSKTINLPAEASVEDVMKVYMLAADLKCKGITVYRDKSRGEQVLNVGQSPITKHQIPNKPASPAGRSKIINSNDQNGELCPECNSKLALEEGCKKCYGCGYSVC